MSKKKQKQHKKRAAKTAVSTSHSIGFSLPLLIALLVTFLVFSGSLGNDFVNWDDDINILENTNLDSFTAENVGRIFHPAHGRIIGNYNPLPIFTFAVEKAVFGLNPTVFHFTNLMLHLLCVFFVYLLGKKLGLSDLAAGLLALLFGIHPMRVESVAWVTERKDVLFGAFYLGAMLTYIQYLANKGKKWFWYTLLLFVFSLFSKIQAVSLPLSLLVLDYWLKRPLNLKVLLEKTPFFLLSLLFGLMGIYFLGEDGTLEDASGFSIFERLLIGAYSYVVYLMKFIIPYEMSPMYPYPANLDTKFYTAPIGVLGVIALFFTAWKKDWRALVFGLAFFTFNIMFLLQILGAGQGFIADRFTYIAYLGIFFSVAYGFDSLLKNKPQMKTALMVLCTAVLLVYSFVSYKQIKIWENGYTLWTHVNKYYDNVTTPWVNLGHYFRDRNEKDKAVEYYSKALQINPKKGRIYNSRGKITLENGNAQAALEDFTKGITHAPDIGEIHINQGAAYGTLGQYDKAMTAINKGLELDPDNKNGYSNRSMLYLLQNKPDLAIKDHETYLSIDPSNANIWYERGQVSNRMGNYSKALESLNRAIQINPSKPIYYKERAKANAALGNEAAAQQDAQRAG